MQGINFVEELDEDAPGVIMGIWRGNRRIVEAIDYKDIMTLEPIREDMHMRIASITKTYTSTIILKLAADGFLSLNDYAYSRLSRDYPWYSQLPKNITIQQLGNMTSGLFNYTDDEYLLSQLDDNPDREWDNSELIAIALKHKPYFKPGQGWYYSNTNYVLLGLIAEHVTGKPMERLYSEIIFEPLELKNTFTPHSNGMPVPFSHGYMLGYSSERTPNNVIRDVTFTNPSYASFAGYLISNIEDMKTFIKPFALGTLIGNTMTQVRNKTFVNIGKGYYGFGVLKLAGGWLGHNGSMPGFQTAMYYQPELDMTVIVLTNLQTDSAGLGPADDIAKSIISAINKNPNTLK